MKISWQTKAIRQWEKIKDKDMRLEISKGTKSLCDFPNCKHIKSLKNHKHDYRLRVHRYRVMFNVDYTNETIVIEEVKKRDDHTY